MPHTNNEEKYWDERLKTLKEYVEKNPLRKAKKPVRQRTKKGSITIESSFSPFLPELKDVELQVKATPQAWKKIESFTLDHPDWFGLEFHSHFANPVVLEISEKNKPRGRQKNIYYFVNEIKIRAAILYAFFSYWCKKPIVEWPDYLQRFVEMIKEDDWFDSIFRMKRGANKPYRLTRYCIENVYREEINELKLKFFDDPFNFSQTYIHADGRAERFKKFFESKSPQEVTAFPFTIPALKNIFETLQVL